MAAQVNDACSGFVSLANVSGWAGEGEGEGESGEVEQGEDESADVEAHLGANERERGRQYRRMFVVRLKIVFFDRSRGCGGALRTF